MPFSIDIVELTLRRRRRRQDSLLETLVNVPWWISVVVGAAVVAGLLLAPAIFQFTSPVFAGVNVMISKLPSFAPYAAIPFAVTAGASALRSFWDRTEL